MSNAQTISVINLILLLSYNLCGCKGTTFFAYMQESILFFVKNVYYFTNNLQYSDIFCIFAFAF